uniref:YopX family protein n=1 Tax=Enterococcus faecalis TaxID=1351 RepID=UPI001C8F828D
MILKFRAWDKNTNDMVDVKTIDLEKDGSIGCIVDYNGINLDVSECVLMQSTGLKDKNGVDIFEGDILKIIEVTNEGISEYITDVIWED